MTDYDSLLSRQKSSILKALTHLKYSFGKTARLGTNPEKLDTESLEAWEGLVSRFARVADLFLAKYLRSYVLRSDAGFRGTLRDFLDQAEKMGLIEDAAQWMEIREVRNVSAHEYAEEKLESVYQTVRALTPRLLDLERILGP